MDRRSRRPIALGLVRSGAGRNSHANGRSQRPVGVMSPPPGAGTKTPVLSAWPNNRQAAVAALQQVSRQGRWRHIAGFNAAATRITSPSER